MNSKFQKSLSSTITRSKYITNFNLHGQAGGTLPQKNGCDRNLFRSIRATLDRLTYSYEDIIKYQPRVTFKNNTTNKHLKLSRWAVVTNKLMGNQIVWAGQCFFMRYRNLIGEIKNFVRTYDYRSIQNFDNDKYDSCVNFMISIHKHSNEINQYHEALAKSNRLLVRAKNILKIDTSKDKMMKMSINKIIRTIKRLYTIPTLQKLQDYKRRRDMISLKKYGDSINSVFKSITYTDSNKLINQSRSVDYKLLPQARQKTWTTQDKIRNPQFYQHRVLTSKAYKKGLL